MKKQLLLISFIFFFFGTVNAQVNSIPFSQSLDTFQFISGTVVDMPNEDDFFHSNLPLGFNFTYNGQVSSKFGISTNGYILLDSLPHGSPWIFGPTCLNQVNAMMGDLYNENIGGSIEYITIGTAPNRVCIVQWKDYGIFIVPYCHLNFQIRLYETSNCIQFYYGDNDYSVSTGVDFVVGLTGDSTNDFNLRTCTTDWTNSAQSLSFSSTGMFMNPLTIQPSGLVFSFGACPSTGITFSYLSGKVYDDINGNGVMDIGENGKANVLLHESTQNYYTNTDSSGNYYLFFLDSSLIYSVHPTPPTYWNISSAPTTYTVTPLTSATTSINFGLLATPNIHDVSIVSTYSSLPWPNAMVNFHATYHNNGTVVESGDSIFFVKDSHYSFITSTPAPDYTSGDSIVWIYSNLLINEFRNINLQLQADTIITIGDTLHSAWTIKPISGDAAPTDNIYEIEQACLAAFDPNAKSVTPDGGIVNTQELEYTIYFQNTGTAPANNVFLIDTLDSNLDLTSFKLMGSSHPVSYSITGSSRFVFTFANINLPDSNSNEPASHGSVTYRIKPISGLSGGSQIQNTANIIFDYNLPIITNTTQNFILESIPNDIGEYDKENHSLIIYPNPTENNLLIKSKIKLIHPLVLVSDLSGKLVMTKQFTQVDELSLDLNQLQNGIYLLEVIDNGNSIRKKLIKQ